MRTNRFKPSKEEVVVVSIECINKEITFLTKYLEKVQAKRNQHKDEMAHSDNEAYSIYVDALTLLEHKVQNEIELLQDTIDALKEL